MTTTTSQAALNAQARSKAQAVIEGLAIKATSQVEYRSRGRVAVIGGPQALEFAPRLQDKHQTTVILLHGAEEPSTAVIPVGGRKLEISGYLGNFTIAMGKAGSPNFEAISVDLVLDLSQTPLFDIPMPPPGYLHCADDENSLAMAHTQLDELIGTFNKPRYFAYDASICVHARVGHTACNRCLEACPAQAITSLTEAIEVDPYLCQGGGVCASVCPSGAIRYNYPAASDTLDRIRTLLQVYHQQGGVQPVVAIIAEHDVATLAPLPSHMLPIVVEEVASIGLDVWLATLAYGARRILLIEGTAMPSGVRNALLMQLFSAEEILSGLGYPENAISLIASDELSKSSEALMPEFKSATFAGLTEKRRTIFMALDHLHEQSQVTNDIVPLSAGAPFGTLQVDTKSCTLCLSCTSVCPTHAVFAGNETPKLLFNESQCVQCGLCATICPEHAITLESRLIVDPELRQRHVTLHEEEALCCVSCGKPFATKSVITSMLAKLEGHYMFQSERAKRRLLMCEDCRVVDVVQDQDAMEQGYTTPRRQ